HALPELLGRVLASRGIGLDEVPVALDPTVKALMPDPSTVRDMEKGAARLAQAIVGNEPIAVFGDYDVDGACSAALMQRFLAAHGVTARIYIPDRMTEGYGPSRDAIEALAKDARLIVTVDCGTTSAETLATAGPLGADAAGLAVPPTPYHLGFVLGPRINAGGRIGDAALGARLLATCDEMEAARIAVLLDKLNRERKAIETQMLEEAIARAEQLVEADPDIPLLLIGADGWHKGVVGLVASRLTERFHRPACVIAWN